MTRVSGYAIIAASTFQLACGESAVAEPGVGGSSGSGGGGASSSAGGSGANSAVAGSGGSNPASGGAAGASVGAPRAADQPHHLGKPFRIVDGVISAESNDEGLQASFYVVHNPKEAAVQVTTTTGQVCVNGALRRAVTGDFGSYQGLDIGFSVGPTQYRTLSETRMSLAPDAPPWELHDRVLGIAVTVTGRMPIIFGSFASPGGQDPGGQYGQVVDVTLFSTCNHPPITSSGQVSVDFFGDMRNVWCLPEYQKPWSAPNVSAFFWSIGSVVVDQIIPGGLNDEPDAYDFCLRDIRPILAGAGPDEAADPLLDAGAGSAGDAGDAGAPDSGG